MQVAIDIDENLYTRLFDNGDIDAADMLKACAAIRKGIPIPKEHGRLIDADDIDNHIVCHVDTRSCPTIIEADKGSEQE